MIQMTDIADSRSIADRFLTFSVGGVSFGIGLQCSHEVLEYIEVRPLPGLPAFVRGVIRLREQVIPVGDTRTWFAADATVSDELTFIVVLKTPEGLLGLIVDDIDGIITIPETAIEREWQQDHGAADSMINGVAHTDDRVILLLDVEKALAAIHASGSRHGT
jgi:purine-binding chemotaxis protein CheW